MFYFEVPVIFKLILNLELIYLDIDDIYTHSQDGHKILILVFFLDEFGFLGFRDELLVDDRHQLRLQVFIIVLVFTEISFSLLDVLEWHNILLGSNV